VSVSQLAAAAKRGLALFWRVPLRPGPCLSRLAEERDVAAAGASVLWAGAVYAGFSLALAVAGHRPSFTLVPLPHYYGCQAVFVIPWLWLLWRVCARVAHGLARRLGGRDDPKATLALAGPAYAVPLVWLFLVPDLVVYGLWGHAAMGTALRYYAAFAPLASIALLALGLARAHGLTAGRALGAALGAYVCQALIGTVLLR
jgi:hypothetical protein